ncbi:MAG TPA: hypothetical protein VGB37_00325 [Candidatus Lokiarchaeia archaeon]
MTKDALKFFHAYINEMIDIGGQNLPKAISSKLGTKLGRIYKERGVIDLESGLIKSFKVLKGNPKILKKNDNEFDINIKYRNRGFCPIGGRYNPERGELVQKCLCVPFYLGFVSELYPKFKYTIRVQECILNKNTNYCKFVLNINSQDL